MSGLEIFEKQQDIRRRLAEHDKQAKAARLQIEAELLALQHCCPHGDVTSESDCGRGGEWAATTWTCQHCGKSQARPF